MDVLPGVAVVAPGVDFLDVRPYLQALVQLHCAIQAAPRGVAHAVLVALRIALQTCALRDKGLLHQTAPRTALHHSAM